MDHGPTMVWSCRPHPKNIVGASWKGFPWSFLSLGPYQSQTQKGFDYHTILSTDIEVIFTCHPNQGQRTIVGG